jgi:hypothetical protein
MKHKSIQLCMCALIATIIVAVPASAQPDILPGVRAALQAPVREAMILIFHDKGIKAAPAQDKRSRSIS